MTRKVPVRPVAVDDGAPGPADPWPAGPPKGPSNASRRSTRLAEPGCLLTPLAMADPFRSDELGRMLYDDTMRRGACPLIRP